MKKDGGFSIVMMVVFNASNIVKDCQGKSQLFPPQQWRLEICLFHGVAKMKLSCNLLATMIFLRFSHACLTLQVVRQYITSNIFGGDDVMHVFEITFNLYIIDISNNTLMFSMMCCEASYKRER